MSDNNLVPAVLTVVPQLPLKGIYYIGQYGTSGYASAAKGYLFQHFMNGLPITWEPLYFDNSKLSDDNVYDIVVKSLINKPIPHHDIVIMHCTPDLWPKFWKEKYKFLNNRIVNGYCTWETNRLPPEWVKCMNTTVNEVWCPSEYNKKAFEDSGVTKTIRVYPHVFLPQTLPPVETVKLIDSNGHTIQKNDRFTFYSIGEMNIRKGFEDTIRVFCNTFKESDKVRLILKVHYKNYSNENKKKCEGMIAAVLKDYVSHPQIIVLLNNMTSKEMLAIHSIGDCYVSLTKAEGFGLTIFDAFNYKKKIIATGYSGHMDYLTKNYPGLVGYKLGPVKGMESFSFNYTSEQMWAYPDLIHAGELMEKVI